MHQNNWFVTLTYSDEHLPAWGSLKKADFQGFINRVRKTYGKVRYFHCGEYGDETRRPHYHAALFGLDLDDLLPWIQRGEHKTWRSPRIEQLWGKGHCEIGTLTFESAGYISRYVTKKRTGTRAHSHYERVCPDTGELRQIEREYATMSRRPGIGAGWLEKFGKEVYPSDEVIMRGKVQKPPRYYDKKIADRDPDLFERVRSLRATKRDRANQTEERLRVREVCTVARTELFQRRAGVA